MDIQIDVVTSYKVFLSMQAAWDDLLDRCSNDCVSLTFDWFRSWWAGFGRGNRLFILTLKNKGQLIGIAPLMMTDVRYRNFPVRRIGFMQNDNSPSADFIIERERGPALEMIAAFLRHRIAEWDIVHLMNMPKESPNYGAFLSALRSNGLMFGVKKGLSSPFISIESDWETYFSGRTRKFKKVLRNKVNRLNKMGAYEVRNICSIDSYKDILSTIFTISGSSWKAGISSDITNSPENITFFTELSRAAGNKGWLSIWLLQLNGKAVAYEYHINYKGKVYALRSDYDESYSGYSPGSVLDMHIVKSVFGEKLKEYNMCGSSDLYKLNWTRAVREHAQIIIYNDNMYGRLLHFLEFRFISSLRKYEYMRKIKSLFDSKERVRRQPAVLRSGE